MMYSYFLERGSGILSRLFSVKYGATKLLDVISKSHKIM